MERYFIICFFGQRRDTLDTLHGNMVHITKKGLYPNRDHVTSEILANTNTQNVTISNIIEVTKEESKTFLA